MYVQCRKASVLRCKNQKFHDLRDRDLVAGETVSPLETAEKTANAYTPSVAELRATIFPKGPEHL